jgi:hypothetical protein
MEKIANGDYPQDYDFNAELLELKRTHEEFVSFYFEQLIPKVGMLLFLQFYFFSFIFLFYVFS